MESAKGYVALTDPDWYHYLATRPKLDEVNFWQPHSGQAFRALKPGDPFFFKLRAPYRAIAGFGFYQRFETLPAHVAWELFGETNGAPDEKSMVKSILSHRHDLTRGSNDFSIGCIMIAAPVFFGRDEWVSPPSDWAPSGIQKGKTYDVLRGEGQRLLAECMERATGGLHYWNVDRSSEAVGETSLGMVRREKCDQGWVKASSVSRCATRMVGRVQSQESTPCLFWRRLTSCPTSWEANTVSKTDCCSEATSIACMTEAMSP